MSLEDADAGLRSQVLAAFVDGEPLTVEDVAIATCVPEPAVEDALAELVEDGELHRTTVRGVDIRQRKEAERADVDLERPVELYHRDEEDLRDGIGTEDGHRIDAEDRRDRQLARQDVEGASDMMRDWRRDAVRGAHDYLREEGPCDDEEIREAVYPAHEAGFSDEDAWWECVRPRLARLPGVAVADGEWLVED